MTFEHGVIIGLLGGILISFILTHYLAGKLCRGIAAALKEQDQENKDSDPANWWKNGGNNE